MKELAIQLLHCSIASLLSRNNVTMKQCNNEFNSNQNGITALAVLTILGLFLAITLTLLGTGTIKIPGSRGIPVTPIPNFDPVEDDKACNDPYNADCEALHDPEDLTPEQIQKALEQN